jgi:hypothetical protein
MTTPQPPDPDAPAAQPGAHPHPRVKPGRHEAATEVSSHPAGRKVKRRVPEKKVVVKAGPVTFVDKLKGYYKGLIFGLGVILSSVATMTPALDQLPAQDKHYVSLGILVVSTALAVLKKNEDWVNGSGG